ncbi:sensor histidine kinase [Lactiplantibacillus plajomi]|uniref:Histidine kinase n=1 Tax=Lactiplantibacillus plajomi TaxID=1457217 RepID=A0ABV6K5H0_9LACO|nr:sensor histidine kinase [Lactiplantibacillus plajomi]
MPFSNHVQRSSFTHLIKLYTIIISVMVILATGIFVGVSIRTYNAEVSQAESTAERQISQTLARNQQVVNQTATQLPDATDNLTSLTKYFSLSPGAYSDYAIDESLRGRKYFYWPTEARQLFVQNESLSQLTLRLANQPRVFVATTKNTGGQLVNEKRVKQAFALSAPLINPYTLQTDGVISMSFDQSALKDQLNHLMAVRPLQIAVRSDANDQLFYFAGVRVNAQQQRAFKRALSTGNATSLKGYHVTEKTLPSGYQLTMAVNQSALFGLLFGRVLPVVVLGILLFVGLSVGLWLTFRRYQHQLDTIVATVKTVSAGDYDARVPVDLKPTDLHTLADGINVMLTEIHRHIHTIYQLQIAQQEANRKALQSQINPHFMSNTLEYIRMAALDADQPELAEVVYSFAALLRNNTDLSSRTTIKQELSFIEKYVFLYQVRFPDQIAYQFQIDPAVADVEVPKFSLQPLVENYFVHGIDFTRFDNAVSVKAWREGSLVRIKIRNNGKGLTDKQIASINARMQEPFDAGQHRSIGLQNVYSRMADYFGASFMMTLSHDEPLGVTVNVQFSDQLTTKNQSGQAGIKSEDD